MSTKHRDKIDTARKPTPANSKERGAMRAQLMKDMLPSLLEQARNEVTAGSLVKMKEDVTLELKEENRKRFEATRFL